MLDYKEYGDFCQCGRYALTTKYSVVVDGWRHSWVVCEEESKVIVALSDKDIKLMGKGIHKMYFKILATPPFVKGNIFPRLIRELENIGVDFSAIDVLQFEQVRIEE